MGMEIQIEEMKARSERINHQKCTNNKKFLKTLLWVSSFNLLLFL